MINSVSLTGRLTRDPELRKTQSGIAVATFTLAVARQYTNSQGEREADFVNCVIWRKPAENLVNLVSKGSLIGVQGRIQTRVYEDKEGQKVHVTEIVVDSFSLLESHREQANGNTKSQKKFNSASTAPTVEDPFVDTNSVEISDDDLPF